MSTKERYQNPIAGDDVNLRLFTYNGYALTNIQDIVKVDVFYLDPEEKTAANPDGRRLVDSFSTSAVIVEDTGTYLLSLELDRNKYLIGKYVDVWSISVAGHEPIQTIEQTFEVLPDFWYTTPTPIVYDFKFNFRPNRLRQGSNQFIIVEVIPNVPRASELESYYQNLAIVSQMWVSIEQTCGPCLPTESDLRIIVDEDPIQFRERRFGYYKLDTTDMDCGIYNIWFKLLFGECTYISEKMQLQIF